MNNEYGFSVANTVENSQFIPYPPNLQHLLILDLAQMMKVYGDNMKLAFDMGRQVALDEEIRNMPHNAPPIEAMAKKANAKFLGAFDNYSYGVYQTHEKFRESLKYWDASTLQTAEFEDYENALEFARCGVSRFKRVSEKEIKPMQYYIDWRQIA